MTYITQGTVQIKINDDGDHYLMIDPIQDYVVKHAKQDYIVFIDITDMKNAKLFDKSKSEISIKKGSFLIQPLINAAFKKTNIEIEVEIDDSVVPAITTIKSIRIPAIS